MDRHDDFVLAVLLVDGTYLLQLRDNSPAIDHPGVWGLFGGRVEPGESPPEAVLREVKEELSVVPPACRFLWTVSETARDGRNARRYWFFEADFSHCWGEHRLTEGADARCFAYHETSRLEMPDIIRRALARHRSALTAFA